MRLPLLSSLHRSSLEVARRNAWATLEVIARRRREHEEVESFLCRIEPERSIAQ